MTSTTVNLISKVDKNVVKLIVIESDSKDCHSTGKVVMLFWEIHVDCWEVYNPDTNTWTPLQLTETGR